MSDNNSTIKNFLTHLVILIKDNMEKQSPMSMAPNSFEEGKSLAYHEVADLVLECSRIFDFPLTELGINDFNPDGLI